MHPFNAIADTFDVTPVRSRPVLAPRVPAVTALAAERRAPNRRKKLKWRTRDSQASQLYNLELDVMHLQQEIQRLAEYQQILDARTFNRRDALDGYYVKTVQEYHRVFENGYRPGTPLDATQYVMQTMDENLSIGGFSGRGVMLHQWEQYTKALSGLEFHYLRSQVLSMEGHTVVTSYASYKHIVTRDTVEVMFPEALRQYPRIVTKMLGRVFKGVGKFDFVFDTQTHNIISFDFELDFLEEFSRLLQDPRDLCAIFKGARITDECLIGDVIGYGEVTSSPNAGASCHEVEVFFVGHARFPLQKSETNSNDSVQVEKRRVQKIAPKYLYLASTISRPTPLNTNISVSETFGVTPVRYRPVLAPRVPAVAALAAARRAPDQRKKLKWRTRDSQASQLYNLELDVMDLRQEIQRLTEYQQILSARTFNRRDALDGYYVKTRKVMLHQWEQYTKALSELEFHYLRSQVVSAEGRTIVTSYASYRHVVTRDILEVMFSNLLGRVCNGAGRIDFTFDTQSHYVVSFDFEVDFLEVFARLLWDSRELCGARISEECLIGDVACYKEIMPLQDSERAEAATANSPKWKLESRFDIGLEDKTSRNYSNGELRQPSLTRTGKRKQIWE
ncbi:uncharacterized protein PITG_06162 [Phytophthora infestans T30-4]|uniref:Bzip transcription factor n=1 Tax=Phytophthora infestans (strain T30-4) TaxID=403677 RepID=D0N6J3_PHYIT|nr:uncharacterized protein PITG_06162 [Phytophthora infestans T30-4]EEY70684.1 conserved hypothetical protein [Phytophthora infestans T30-4]|eukprot:XP_002998338.1 conserved hypothetical protein [Phytophthora infestans T30-4]